jgi:hypothetical protein
MAYEGGTVSQVLARLQACLDRADQKPLEGTNTRFAAAYFFGDALEPAGAALGRQDLDQLRTTRPVLVRNADGHKFWMNSRAIANAGLDERTPDPPDGTIGRDAARRPNGFFADYDAGDWGIRKPVTAEARLERVQRTMADAHRAGVTAVLLPGGGQDEIADWVRLQDEGGLDLRVSVGLSASFVLETRDPAELAKRVEALGAYNASLQLAPDLADAHYNAARLHEQLGDAKNAVRHFSAYRRLERRR